VNEEHGVKPATVPHCGTHLVRQCACCQSSGHLDSPAGSPVRSAPHYNCFLPFEPPFQGGHHRIPSRQTLCLQSVPARFWLFCIPCIKLNSNPVDTTCRARQAVHHISAVCRTLPFHWPGSRRRSRQAAPALPIQKFVADQISLLIEK